VESTKAPSTQSYWLKPTFDIHEVELNAGNTPKHADNGRF